MVANDGADETAEEELLDLLTCHRSELWHANMFLQTVFKTPPIHASCLADEMRNPSAPTHGKCLRRLKLQLPLRNGRRGRYQWKGWDHQGLHCLRYCLGFKTMPPVSWETYQPNCLSVPACSKWSTMPKLSAASRFDFPNQLLQLGPFFTIVLE